MDVVFPLMMFLLVWLAWSRRSALGRDGRPWLMMVGFVLGGALLVGCASAETPPAPTETAQVEPAPTEQVDPTATTEAAPTDAPLPDPTATQQTPPTVTAEAEPTPDPGPVTIDLVDPLATDATRSLFVFLREIRGNGILFGHQHATTYGLSIGEPDGTASEVYNAVGDYPALFGWDTLSIDGWERPGSTEASKSDNIAELASYIEQAHALGSIVTISTHPYNFLTGNDFYDATSGVVTAILPGGEKNAELNAYLDGVAELANAVTDENGDPIPLIFRPFHENNGSWFWWGASQSTPGEYIELYRYTVEYLRDVKGVHNLLYAYSPNGAFGGNPEEYLRTYPGDAFVDILGYDHYDNTGGSAEWRAATVQDLAMVAAMADEKGKISAFTEFGVGGALLPNGENPNLTWFSDLLTAIQSDPGASRSAYMQTWANFDATQYFVPFPENELLPAHELLPDFQAMAEDPFSLFASDLEGVWTRDEIGTVGAAPTARLVTPADGQRLLSAETVLRAKVDGITADRVILTTDIDDTEYELTLADSGYYEAVWPIGEENLANRTATISLLAETAEGDFSDEATVILGEKPELPPGMVDNFEGYFDETALRDEYTVYQSNTISLERESVGAGEKALRFDYDFGSQEYTGVGRPVEEDWSDYDTLRLWLQPDGNDHRLVLQIVANGLYMEVYPSMAGTEAGFIEIPLADFAPAPWDESVSEDRRLTPEDLAAMAQFNIYINANPEAATAAGSFLIDEIQAVASE